MPPPAGAPLQSADAWTVPRTTLPFGKMSLTSHESEARALVIRNTHSAQPPASATCRQRRSEQLPEIVTVPDSSPAFTRTTTPPPCPPWGHESSFCEHAAATKPTQSMNPAERTI